MSNTTNRGGKTVNQPGISDDNMSTLKLWQMHLTAIREDAIAKHEANVAREKAHDADVAIKPHKRKKSYIVFPHLP